MVTTLYLVRHGETEGSEVKRYKGSIDVPLSEKGIEQMEQVAKYLNRSYKTYSGLKAVYCSPLIRALKSAEIVAEPHGLKPIVIPDLRERSFGIWEGMSFNEIKDKYPEEFEAWAGNPLKYSPVGGESTLEVRDRVIIALNKILNDHNSQGARNIAIVAHGGVNRIILCHIMGIPLENIFRIEQDNAAVNIIEFWEKYPVVKALNLTIPC
ncbi:MAG: alpha-ribazole phosphatase [Thermodesulfovibrionales bacterium]|jgi:alpha-ribazole phosphatase|nr:alpha-ribazole phosphatase [Thermodesulfovibrionales bacterium]